MKIVLNKRYGGFSIPDAYLESIGEEWLSAEEARTDPRFIEWLETHHNGVFAGRHSKLCVRELPEGITDWEVDEYDGFETATYVLNGKLGHA